VILRYQNACVMTLLACCATFAAAQQGTPHAGYVYPAGGQQGTSFEVVVGGQFLSGVSGALITGNGVSVSVLEWVKPIQPGEASTMRDRLKVLTDKQKGIITPAVSPANNKPVNSPNNTATITTTNSPTNSANNSPHNTAINAVNNPTNNPSPANSSANNLKPTANTDTSSNKLTDAELSELHDLRLKLLLFQKRTTNVSIAEKVRLKIGISPDAPAGQRELRLAAANGITNPLYFIVGRLPEWSKPPAGSMTQSDLDEQLKQPNKGTTNNPSPTPVVELTTPLLVNGQVAPGGVDQYRFHAHKGERLVVEASARELIPYIADAVPGWFQASLTLYDASGKELQYADHYSFHPDPALLVEIPADGEYTLAIHDSIYRGREDFVYRVALGEIPFVTGMFPLGGRAGAKTPVEFTGWNLGQTRITQHSRGKDKGVELLAPAGVDLDARPFALDTLPESMAKDQNHSRTDAQKISLPVIVNGRVSQPGEWEYFQFKGKTGEAVEAEVYARRLDSPLDSVLALTDASAMVLAPNDDFVDESAGLITDQADSRILVHLPADGSYFLRLGDTQQNGGPQYAYRLRVSAPQPDFELRITPSSINARAGSVVPITVHALRLGGFDGDIVVKLKDAPHGFQLSGDVVPGNQSQVPMTLSVPLQGGNRTSHLSLQGFATVGGKQMQRSSLPADDWEQAFFYHHLVTTTEMLLTVSGQQRRPAAWAASWDHPLELLQGRPAMVRFDLPTALNGQVKFELNDPPPGIAISRTVPVEGGVLVYLMADKARATSGLRGNLLISTIVERPNAQGKGKGVTQTMLMPALPFEVFAPAAQPDATHDSAALQHALPQPK
jgi:hypothetical protein